MKHPTLLYLSVLLFVVAISCRKDSIKNPPPVEDPVSDARTILLKSIIEPGLPNPYFSLSYDANGFATGINFADSLQMYQFAYKNNRVDKVTNTRIPQTLQYYYTGKHVSYISHLNAAGIKTRSYKLQYDQEGRLKILQWFAFSPAADSICTRKVIIEYGAGNNLSSYQDFRGGESGDVELRLSATHVFSNYDNGVNTDDFALFKGFFDELLFLPQVRLQNNNPGIEIIQGATTEKRIEYHYRYQNGLPVEKSGTLKVTSGPDAGSEFQFSIQMNYY